MPAFRDMSLPEIQAALIDLSRAIEALLPDGPPGTGPVPYCLVLGEQLGTGPHYHIANVNDAGIVHMLDSVLESITGGETIHLND